MGTAALGEIDGSSQSRDGQDCISLVIFIILCISICKRKRTASCMHGWAAKKGGGEREGGRLHNEFPARLASFLSSIHTLTRGAHIHARTRTQYWLSIATVVHGIALHCIIIIRRKTGPGGFN